MSTHVHRSSMHSEKDNHSLPSRCCDERMPMDAILGRSCMHQRMKNVEEGEEEKKEEERRRTQKMMLATKQRRRVEYFFGHMKWYREIPWDGE
jgi:hypothetical protein